MIEQLENRLLFAGAKITSVIADNRGEVLIGLNAPVQASMVNKGSVQMYTPGPDNALGTSDDVQVTPSIRWTASNNRITVRANLQANTAYRIKLVATRMRDSTMTPIDGDFSGRLPSGNGKAGGNFEFQVKHDKGTTPSVRMSSNAGVITVRLATALVPDTVKNFLAYANSGRYDNTIIHRNGRTDFVNGPIDIVQGGGYTSTNVDIDGNPTDHIDTFNPVNLEVGLDNIRGTVAMARATPPDSATSEFFFNTQDNDFLNPTSPNNGYCAFGTVTTSSLVTIDAMFESNTVAPNDAFNAVPQVAGENIFFRRVALLYRVVAL